LLALVNSSFLREKEMDMWRAVRETCNRWRRTPTTS
jgi:hypothetical protein